MNITCTEASIYPCWIECYWNVVLYGIMLWSFKEGIGYNNTFMSNILNSNQYTIELFAYFSTNYNWNHYVGCDDTSMSAFNLRFENTPQYSRLCYGNYNNLTFSIPKASSGLIQNQFNHIAVCKNKNNVYLFVNGNKISQTKHKTIILPNAYFTIGGRQNYGDGGSTGNIDTYNRVDEVRISDVCRYTSNFTPPTEPFS